MNYQLPNQLLNLKTHKLFLSFGIVAVLVFAAQFASAQTVAPAKIVNEKALRRLTQKLKLDGKRMTAYDMGVEIAFGWFRAEITQAEWAKQDPQNYEALLKPRREAFYKASTDAEAINSVISTPSDKIDTAQFLKYTDASHEGDAVSVASSINTNLRQKLSAINSNLFDAYIFGFELGFAEARASGNQEADRESILVHLIAARDMAKNLKIYKPGHDAIIKTVQNKDPLNKIYPQIVSLRQSYQIAVGNLK